MNDRVGTCPQHGTLLSAAYLGDKAGGDRVFQVWCPRCKLTQWYRIGEGADEASAVGDYFRKMRALAAAPECDEGQDDPQG